MGSAKGWNGDIRWRLEQPNHTVCRSDENMLPHPPSIVTIGWLFRWVCLLRDFFRLPANKAWFLSLSAKYTLPGCGPSYNMGLGLAYTGREWLSVRWWLGVEEQFCHVYLLPFHLSFRVEMSHGLTIKYQLFLLYSF